MSSDSSTGKSPPKKKNVKYERKFVNSLLKDASETYFFCSACNCDRKCSIHELLRHKDSAKHAKNSLTLQKQQKLTSMFTSASNSQDTKNIAKAGEVKMACFIAEHNLSFNITSHLNKLICAVCPDSKIAEQLSMSRTKARAIIVNVTGKTSESEENIVEMLQNNCFALLVDESTDKSTIKHLALVVRITLIPIEDGTATALYGKIVEYFVEKNISYKSNMIGFASDGANVMFGDKHSLVTLFKNDIPHLFTMKSTGDIIWQNPRPSSTMYCQRIKLIFSNESTDFTVSETNKVMEEVNSLVPIICSIGGNKVSVKHTLLLKMINGKVCNALTETSISLKCYICGATPKQMNDFSREYTVNRDNLGFGLSTLHAWIRCFECMLHISYRLEIKKWQVKGAEDKAKVKQQISSNDMQKIDTEWRLLRNTKLDSADEDLEIETFWKKVAKMHLGDGNKMFPNLTSAVFSFMCLPHSSASVERLFSQVNITKTKLWVLHTKNILKNRNCYDFEVKEKIIEKHNKNIY
ncbi:hypothetical protein ABMA27_003042 [Loxostege sticticalis]|uniref:HAT C-terminal dimerisation domain-containing protein n=1 Tax=Loxostege sticticalis TaxID=481309 RepID=A0ABR3HRT0_LOXSC